MIDTKTRLQVEKVRKAYVNVKEALEALPACRMRALALTNLESSFSCAVFAVADITSPIGEE